MSNEQPDEFWIEFVRRCGSNSATSGYADIEAMIQSGRLDAKQLRLLSTSLRALSDLARDGAADQEDRIKRPWAHSNTGVVQCASI